MLDTQQMVPELNGVRQAKEVSLLLVLAAYAHALFGDFAAFPGRLLWLCLRSYHLQQSILQADRRSHFVMISALSMTFNMSVKAEEC